MALGYGELQSVCDISKKAELICCSDESYHSTKKPKLNQLHDICNMFVWRHVNSSYSQYVRDTVSVISELLSVKSFCMDLSILPDSDIFFVFISCVYCSECSLTFNPTFYSFYVYYCTIFIINK